jgi:hypothetical protein
MSELQVSLINKGIVPAAADKTISCSHILLRYISVYFAYKILYTTPSGHNSAFYIVKLYKRRYYARTE